VCIPSFYTNVLPCASPCVTQTSSPPCASTCVNCEFNLLTIRFFFQASPPLSLSLPHSHFPSLCTFFSVCLFLPPLTLSHSALCPSPLLHFLSPTLSISIALSVSLPISLCLSLSATHSFSLSRARSLSLFLLSVSLPVYLCIVPCLSNNVLPNNYSPISLTLSLLSPLLALPR
jgi:hypothetical protein